MQTVRRDAHIKQSVSKIKTKAMHHFRSIAFVFIALSRQFKSVASTLFRKVVTALAITTLAVPGSVLVSGLNNRVLAAESEYLNFQARILQSSGAVVPDGNYHVQFKIYYESSNGTALWTETRSPSTPDPNKAIVKNGYISVRLGAITPFPNTINWDQQLFIGMNVGGTGGAPSWDGEMSPRLVVTSVPYAKEARTAAGVTSNNTSSTSTNSDSVAISTGNATGATSNSGNITIDTGTATGATGTISIAGTNASGLTLARAGLQTTIAGNALVQGGALTVGTATQAGSLVISDGSSNTVTLTASGVSTDYSLTLPAAAGTTDQCLRTSPSVASQLVFGACGTVGAVTSVGTIDSQAKSANGAVIANGTLYMQTADASSVGLVSTGTQTFAGNKTFNGTVSVASGTLTVGVDSTTNGSITLYSSGSVLDPTISSDASGNLNVTSPEGSVVVGDGSGGIQLQLANSGDLLVGSKIFTASGAYSSADFSFNRAITGGANNLSGSVLKVEDNSTTSGTFNPTLLYVNQANTNAGGYLINTAQNGVSRFSVAPTGNTVVGGSLSVSQLVSGTSGATISGAAISLNDSSNFNTTINTGTSTGSVSIGNNTGNTAITIDSGTSAINIGTGAQARTTNIGTGAANQTVNVGSTNTTSTTNINAGSGGINATGPTNFTNSVAYKKGTDYSTTGTSNNVNFGDTSLVRLTGSSVQTITGIANGRDGVLLTVMNASNQTAIIKNNDSNSSAANRIITGTGLELELAPGASISLIYDSGDSLWRTVGGSGGASNLQDAYDFSTGGSTSEITLDSTRGGLTLRNATSDSITGNLFEIQNNAGTTTLFGITSSGLLMKDSAGVNTLEVISTPSTHELRVYDTTGANYAIISASVGGVTFAAYNGYTRVGTVGVGGNIGLVLSTSIDQLLATKEVTPTTNYSLSDYNFTRNLTGTSYALTGSVMKVEDLSTFTSGSSAPNVLLVNQNNSSATGNLLLLQTGGNTTRFLVTASGDTTVSGNLTVDTNTLFVDATNNRVGIGTTNPGYTLTVNGEPAANGYTAFTNYSDARLKTNINTLGEGFLDKIMQLQPKSFNYNELTGYDAETRARVVQGFVAQDLQPVFPDMVSTNIINGVEYLDTNLSALPIYLVKGMQEQQTQINSMKSRLTTLENSIQPSSNNILDLTNGGTIQGNLNVIGNLNVTGPVVVESLTVTGNVAIGGDLTVTGETSVKNITINGKIISAGNAPTIALGENAKGKDAEATVTGNDIAGSVSINVGTVDAPTHSVTSGAQVVITFATPYTNTPRITMTPTNEKAGSIRYFVERTATSFIVKFIDTPEAGATYSYDYQIIQ